MNLEIKNIDTFWLLKGIMTAIKESVSADSYDEIEMILKNQMKDVPSCDATGNIINDPIETGDEPTWSNINKYINKLTDECTKVLKWQKNNSCQVTLNKELGFQYRGFDCELSSCTTLSRLEQLSNANNCFTDRYVCWLWGHKDIEGKTKEQSDDPDNWSPRVYLVPDAWNWGAEYDCVPGATVNAQILESIDKLIQDIGEDNL